MEYDRFYGICWYNYFWRLFQLWDMLETDGYHILAQYHLVK
jgi:hypothetical protein